MFLSIHVEKILFPVISSVSLYDLKPYKNHSENIEKYEEMKNKHEIWEKILENEYERSSSNFRTVRNAFS